MVCQSRSLCAPVVLQGITHQRAEQSNKGGKKGKRETRDWLLGVCQQSREVGEWVKWRKKRKGGKGREGRGRGKECTRHLYCRGGLVSLSLKAIVWRGRGGETLPPDCPAWSWGVNEEEPDNIRIS